MCRITHGAQRRLDYTCTGDTLKVAGKPIIIERARVRHWIADQRLGGASGTVLPFHGDCSMPVELFCRGLPDKLLCNLGMEADRAQIGTLRVRCRKCDECQRHRARLWAARASDEIRFSERSWFGTLTLTDANAVRAKFAAEAEATRRGWQLEELSKGELFKRMVSQVSPELTKFLKRIRKNSGARIRYLCVAEEHNSAQTSEERRGMPHWHVLIHENEGRVTERQLSAGWRFGYSQFRLVDRNDTKTPYYVTKYLTKENTDARLRASLDYGRATARNLADRLEAVGLALPNLERRCEGTQITVKCEGTQEERNKISFFSKEEKSHFSSVPDKKIPSSSASGDISTTDEISDYERAVN
jgi:hypothetical protein